MKTVLKHILQLKRGYAALPFFDFLRDPSLPVTERLSFFPCMAPFILAFGDLNAQVLRVEPASDLFQEMINAHSYEDDHHWPWYLEDFKKLGHDRRDQSPHDTLSFLWSEATLQNRMLAGRLAQLIEGADTAVRLAIIEAIEETGQVLFSLTTPLAKAYEQQTGVELRYCGDFHFQLESGHAMNNEHAELARIQLTDAQREDALMRVDAVFELFTAWTHELLAYAVSQRRPVHQQASLLAA